MKMIDLAVLRQIINDNGLIIQVKNDNYDETECLMNIADDLELLLKPKNNGWINVDDELPEPEIDCSRKFKPTKFYLIQLKSGLIDIVAFVNIYYDADDNRDEFVVCTINSENNKYVVQEYGQWQYDINEVKYWQPLPQPPKE